MQTNPVLSNIPLDGDLFDQLRATLSKAKAAIEELPVSILQEPDKVKFDSLKVSFWQLLHETVLYGERYFASFTLLENRMKLSISDQEKLGLLDQIMFRQDNIRNIPIIQTMTQDLSRILDLVNNPSNGLFKQISEFSSCMKVPYYSRIYYQNILSLSFAVAGVAAGIIVIVLQANGITFPQDGILGPGLIGAGVGAIIPGLINIARFSYHHHSLEQQIKHIDNFQKTIEETVKSLDQEVRTHHEAVNVVVQANIIGIPVLISEVLTMCATFRSFIEATRSAIASSVTEGKK